MQSALFAVTLLVIAAFIAVGSTLLAPTNSPLAAANLYMFFGGVVALMVAVVVLAKTNRAIEDVVKQSSLARMAFGLDVALFSFALAGLIARFFVLNVGGFQGYHLLRYVALSIVAIAAVGCAILGLAVAADLRSPKTLFGLLRQLNRENQPMLESDNDPDQANPQANDHRKE